MSWWSLTKEHCESKRFCLIYLLSLFFISHSRLLHSISIGIKYEIQGRNILVRPYEQTRWASTNSLDLSSILVCYFVQTLTTLSLWNNEIGDAGAQYLGEALRTNTVKENHSCWSLFILVCYFTQTLTTLNLNGNQIGDGGVQYLGEALRTNRVRDKKSAWSLFYSCLLFHTDT
jgi:hypothetical protein